MKIVGLMPQVLSDRRIPYTYQSKAVSITGTRTMWRESKKEREGWSTYSGPADIDADRDHQHQVPAFEQRVNIRCLANGNQVTDRFNDRDGWLSKGTNSLFSWLPYDKQAGKTSGVRKTTDEVSCTAARQGRVRTPRKKMMTNVTTSEVF